MVINIEVITLVKFMMQGDGYEEGVWWEIAFVLVFKQGNMKTILYICMGMTDNLQTILHVHLHIDNKMFVVLSLWQQGSQNLTSYANCLFQLFN